MQLAGNLFLDRSELSFRRKMQEILLALQIERRYTKPQIFTMYANQVYLAHGNYGFAAASQFYFGKSVTDLKLQEAALLAGMIRGPIYSPLSDPSAGPFATQPGDPSHGGRREDHSHRRRSREENTPGAAPAISAQRPGALFLRGD